jgi:hypothetical protein
MGISSWSKRKGCGRKAKANRRGPELIKYYYNECESYYGDKDRKNKTLPSKRVFEKMTLNGSQVGYWESYYNDKKDFHDEDIPLLLAEWVADPHVPRRASWWYGPPIQVAVPAEAYVESGVVDQRCPVAHPVDNPPGRALTAQKKTSSECSGGEPFPKRIIILSATADESKKQLKQKAIEKGIDWAGANLKKVENAPFEETDLVQPQPQQQQEMLHETKRGGAGVPPFGNNGNGDPVAEAVRETAESFVQPPQPQHDDSLYAAIAMVRVEELCADPSPDCEPMELDETNRGGAGRPPFGSNGNGDPMTEAARKTDEFFAPTIASCKVHDEDVV